MALFWYFMTDKLPALTKQLHVILCLGNSMAWPAAGDIPRERWYIKTQDDCELS